MKVAIILMGVLFMLVSSFKYSTTRSGSHTGYVTAIQQEGLFFHPYRVYFKTDNSSSQEDSYCIREARPELAEIAKQAQRDNRKVTLDYDGERGFGFHLCVYDRIDNIE